MTGSSRVRLYLFMSESVHGGEPAAFVQQPNLCDLTVLCLAALANTVTISAYLPTYALFVTRELGELAALVGRLMGAFAAACAAGFLAAPWLMMHFTSRALLVISLLLRCVAGALHVAACAASTTTSLHSGFLLQAMLYSSRILMGLNFFSLALATAWVGVRVPSEQRMRFMGAIASAASLGPLLGPAFGSAVASFLGASESHEQRLAAAAAPGWFMLGLNGALVPVALLTFSERHAPLAPPSPGTPDAKSTPWAVVSSAVLTSFLAAAGVLAFESVLGLYLYDAFTIDSDGQFAVFSSIALVSVVAAGIFLALERTLPRSTLAAISHATFVPAAWLAVRWEELSQPPSFHRLLAGVLLLSFSVALLSTLLFGLLVTQLPPEAQPLWNSMVLLAAMLGRAVGPPLALSLYGAAALGSLSEWVGTPIAPGNAAMAFTVAACAAASLVPMMQCRALYSGGGGEADGVAGRPRDARVELT